MSEQALRKLIAKWRHESKEEYQSGPACDCQEPGHQTLGRCANELEVVLAASEPRQAGPLEQHFAGLGAIADIVFGTEASAQPPAEPKEPGAKA